MRSSFAPRFEARILLQSRSIYDMRGEEAQVCDLSWEGCGYLLFLGLLIARGQADELLFFIGLSLTRRHVLNYEDGRVSIGCPGGMPLFRGQIVYGNGSRSQ